MNDRRIKIRANGEDHEVMEGVSLAEFLSERGLALSRVVVERNGSALSPAEARDVTLADNDRLEIVRIVAGG